jgi:release factor glutamine methyltransferase
LNLKRIDLYLNHDRPLREAELATYRGLIKRRLAGYPLQYLTGETEFYSLGFRVNSAALIPRPETEILVEAVLDRISDWPSRPKIADLGTGCGVIAISLAVHLPEALLVATDRSAQALDLAQANATRHGVTERIRFCPGDLFDALRGQEGSFAAVVSNPPYVRSGELESLPVEIRLHEPLLALDGGRDGLEIIRRLVNGAASFLTEGGILALEVGAGQALSVAKLMSSTGALSDPEVIKDYCGVERVVLAERIPCRERAGPVL